MERRRIEVAALLVIVCLCLVPTNTVLAVDDLLPGEAIQSPNYAEYDKSFYIIDYAPPEDPPSWTAAWIPQIKIGMVEFITLLLNLIWSVYMYVVELVIRMVNWAFSTKLFDQLFNLLNSMMPSIVASVWNPLWFLVAGIGVFSAIIIWMTGNTNRSLTTVFSIVLLIAFVPVALASMPSFLKSANALVTAIAGEAMSRMISAKSAQAYFQEEQEKIRKKIHEFNKANSTQKEGETGTWSKNQVQIQGILADGVTLSLHVVDDTIWNTLVKQPYYIANFGSIQQGQKHFDALMSHGDDEPSRDSWIRTQGKLQKETGVADNKAFKIFTTYGLPERFYKLTIATLFPLIPIAVLIGTAIVIMIWKAKAIGRTVFLVFDALMALYHGYGISNAIRGVVRVFAAFIMALFYSIALAIFLAFWSKISDPNTFAGIGFADRIIIVLLLLIGLWAGVQGVRSRLEALPSPSGGIIGGISDNATKNLLGKVKMTRAQLQKTKKGTKNVVQSVVKTVKTAAPGVALAARGIGKAVSKTGKFVAQRPISQHFGAIVTSRVPGLKPKKLQFTAALSENARKTFQDMVKKGYDPADYASVKNYTAQNPDKLAYAGEVYKWTQKDWKKQILENDVNLDGSVIPEPPADKTSPEYYVWKNSQPMQDHYAAYSSAFTKLRVEKQADYQEKIRKYKKNKFMRLFVRPPKFKEPSAWEYLREYRKIGIWKNQSPSGRQNTKASPKSKRKK